VIDDDSTHVCMSFYVRKRRAFFQSVSLVYPKTQNPVVVNGASERAREQSASSNHRYVPSKRAITSEFTSRSHDHDDSPTPRPSY
jgi:hypothetical protein